MNQLSLRSWLLGSHLFVLLLPLLVVVGTGALSVELRTQTRDDLRNQAALIGILAAAEVRHARESDPEASLRDVATPLGPALVTARNATLAGVRLVGPDGLVVATSGDELGADLSSRPEVAEALDGRPGEAIRPRSAPTRQPLSSESRRARVRLFIASPIRLDDELLGVVTLSRTPREELQALYNRVPWWAAAGAGLLTVGVAIGAGYMGTRSLERLASTSGRIADGSFAALGDLARPVRSHVAEVSRLAVSVGRMAERLQARLGYISEFAGNVSHEFRTPISTLRGTVELLRDDDQMPAEQRAKFLHNALLDLERMDRLVTGLLALARAEQTGAQRPFPLDEVVMAVASRHPGLVREGATATVHGDPAQIETVLDNLVQNAFRHGGPGVRVRTIGFADEATTGFEVVDGGPGISAANLPRVFDRFFTTDRDAGGTGLGLALVRAVVAAHGGSVDVQSRPGETRFRVVLPRVRA